MDTAPVLDPIAARQERGRDIAQRMRITRKAPGVYMVPASKPPPRGGPPAFYTVQVGKQEKCNCPDHELRGAVMRCKHLWAVEYSRRSETMADGSEKVTETLRVTYSQQWSTYNAAQTHEKQCVADLLADLCGGVEEPVREGSGRPSLPMADKVFAVTMKVYGGMSSRRNDTDMRDLAAKGYLSKAPHYNSVINYMDDPELTPILRRLIQESAAPLASVEDSIAVDSSGFSTCNYVRWFDHKYGREHQEQVWIKAHIAVGPKTNVITAAKVTDGTTNDCPQLPELLAASHEHFAPHAVLADRGYLSIENADTIRDAGAFPYIPFKSSSTGRGTKKHNRGDRELWRKLFGFFTYQREEFLRHYNQRSNVEATFSGVKRVFGGTLRSKTRVGQENELLAKLLCWNLSCLVHEIYELGIRPLFWQEKAEEGPTAKVIPLPGVFGQPGGFLGK